MFETPAIDTVYQQQHSLYIRTFHDGCKQGIDQQIFNRKSISY